MANVYRGGFDYVSPLFCHFPHSDFKLDLKTPGREDDDEETRLYSKNDFQQKTTQQTNAVTEHTINALGEEIIEGLGGRENIETVDNCYTRLRVIVKNIDEIH